MAVADTNLSQITARLSTVLQSFGDETKSGLLAASTLFCALAPFCPVAGLAVRRTVLDKAGAGFVD
jgi:hypothetical protein